MKQLALVIPTAAVLIVGLAGCGDDLTLPAPTPTSLRLDVLTGGDQAGTVGETLQQPVVVIVRNTSSLLPIPGRQVTFAATGEGTSDFDPPTAVTDAQGKALTHWRLGTVPGPYTGEATVLAQDDSTPPPVPFSAMANAGSPDSVRADGPTIQSGRRGEPVDDPLVVVVVDRYGNPV
jgi:hypothetical protein